MILKLHAYEDRKDRADEKSQFGRHHAFDIFATVAVMEEPDWSAATAHRKAHAGRGYLGKAARIARADFSSTSAKGLLRLREHPGYKARREAYDASLGRFIGDMGDLFPG